MGGFKSDSLLDLSCGGFLFNLFLIFSSKNAIYFAQEVNWQDVIDTSNNICQNNAPNYTTRSPSAHYCMYISSIVVEYVYRIGFPPFYQNMTSKSPKCPWSSSKKRKKKVSTTKVMETERKTSLASSDKGSYYQAWTSDEKFNNLVEGANRRKIVEKLDGSLFCDKDLQNSAADDSDSDLEESDSGTQPTESLNIVDGDLLRDAIKEAAICRECKVGELQLKEDDTAVVGLAKKWSLQCKRVDCKAHKCPTRFHISTKDSRFYSINRAVVLAFRAIGRGYSAAQKFFSILDLPKSVSRKPWSRHTKAIAQAAEALLEEELNNAAFEVKCVLRRLGDIEDCTDEELRENITDTGATFDGSWSSRGWSARDGIVAAISVETGKVVDVVYLSGSCNQCTEMENKRQTGQITRLQFLGWYLQHDDNCYMNHDGSSAVSLNFLQLCFHHIIRTHNFVRSDHTSEVSFFNQNHFTLKP